MPGDRIISVDGIETPSFDRMSEIVRERPDQIIPVVVERTIDGQTRQLTLTVETGVEKAPRASDGKFVDVGVLGVGAKIERIRLGPGEALIAGSQAAARASMLILKGLQDIVTGGVSLKAVGGPVAIGQLTGHFARQGISSLLGWVALFSINLAILNLLRFRSWTAVTSCSSESRRPGDAPFRRHRNCGSRRSDSRSSCCSWRGVHRRYPAHRRF